MAGVQFHFERIKQQLLREITWVIANKINDPRIPEVFTVLDINLAHDTRNATVYISFYDTESDRVIEVLNKAAGHIQKIVASRIKIHNFPKLYFKVDSSFARSERINEILKQVKDDLD